MNPPALAFGALMPYIRSDRELSVTIEAWLRSHFLYKRMFGVLKAPFGPGADETKTDIESTSPNNDVNINVNLSSPHAVKCTMNAVVLMSGKIFEESAEFE